MEKCEIMNMIVYEVSKEIRDKDVIDKISEYFNTTNKVVFMVLNELELLKCRSYPIETITIEDLQERILYYETQ